VTNIEVLPFYYFTLPYSTASVNWSGYQLCAKVTSCSSPSTEVYDADGYFAQPTIDYPANHGSNQPGCYYPSSCTLTVWIGLSNYPGSPPSGQTSYLLQAGSADSVQHSTIGGGCNCYTYQLFWENYSMTSSGSAKGSPNYCTTTSNFGDTIEPQVYESSLSGNTGYWYVFAYDATLSKICEPSVSGLSAGEIHWKVVPYWANYIPEIPCSASSCMDLPYFSTFSFYGEMYYSSSYTPISTPYSNNWGNWYMMVNSGVDNMCSGSWSGGSCSSSVTHSGLYGYFPNTWVSSQYT
jgi:hypothetical protein